MDADAAMAFVRRRGIVLVSAKGPAPRLTEAIAGEPIKGSWWGHSKSHEIFAILQKLGDSPDILVCRFIAGRETFVHRRLWPAIVKLAGRFHADRLAQVRQEHTASGRHVNHLTAYPAWVPAEILKEAERLTVHDAETLLKDFIGKTPATARSGFFWVVASTRACRLRFPSIILTMPDAFVYYFLIRDRSSGRLVSSKRRATLEAIKSKGEPMWESRMAVDDSELDATGFLVSRADRGSDPMDELWSDIRSLRLRADSRDREAKQLSETLQSAKTHPVRRKPRAAKQGGLPAAVDLRKK